MTSEWGLLAVAALVFVYALLGKRLSDSLLTAPMLFLFAGWAFQALGLVQLGHRAHGLYLLAEVSLVVLLFADAAAIDPRRLWKGASIPARMLILGLPLAILLGFGTAFGLMPTWPLWELALVAAILAPTDGALSQPIITDPRGLATALFALLVLDAFDLLQMRDEILAIAALAVLVSSVLHGLTAAPAARLFEKETDAEETNADSPLTDT